MNFLHGIFHLAVKYLLMTQEMRQEYDRGNEVEIILIPYLLTLCVSKY
jgi:hypothetical protein